MIEISWEAPKSTGGLDITGYSLQVSNSGGPFKDFDYLPLQADPSDKLTTKILLNQFDLVSNSYLGIDSKTDPTLSVRVRAANSKGFGKYSDAHKSEAILIQPPSPPTGLTVNIEFTKVN